MHFGIQNILFIIALGTTGFFAFKKFSSIVRNIQIGKSLNRNNNFSQRINTLILVALGQSKMVTRPVAGIMHIFVYIGFIIVNIEFFEIITDGILGTHRAFNFLGPVYNILINSFEVLAILVILGCAVFFARRNAIKLKRLNMKELLGWPRNDANIILTTEILLMSAFLIMNSADWYLSTQMNDFPQIIKEFGIEHYAHSGVQKEAFLISPWLSGWMPNNLTYVMYIERFCWWFHIIGVFGFILYLPYSKHLHILLSFPNVFYSNLEEKGKFTNLESVTNEVKAIFDPSFVPPNGAPGRFGAKDIGDLTWKQLLDAYTCTECGRCTSNCPANQTGKLLSPRKIMMDTRDRIEEVGRGIDKNGKDFKDEKSLLHDYISPEELWACTSCNACVQACPVNIDPLSIIIDLRRYLVMEESAPPSALAAVFTNIENNGAPWQFSPADRLNWINED